jgi:hypothetical protein
MYVFGRVMGRSPMLKRNQQYAQHRMYTHRRTLLRL